MSKKKEVKKPSKEASKKETKKVAKAPAKAPKVEAKKESKSAEKAPQKAQEKASEKDKKKLAVKKGDAKKEAKVKASEAKSQKEKEKTAAVASKKENKKAIVAKGKSASEGTPELTKKGAKAENKKDAEKKDSKKDLGKDLKKDAKKGAKEEEKLEGKKGRGKKGADAEATRNSEGPEDDEEGISSKEDSDDDFFNDDDSEFGGDGDYGPKFEFEDEEIEKELTRSRKKDKTYDDLKDAITDEVVALAEDFPIKDIIETLRGVNFFTAKTDECLEKGCDNPATTLSYCRYHYITNWKDVKKKQTILKEGKLQEFIEDLTKKYPAKFLEAIITDLNDEKSFLGVLKEMDIDADDDDAFDDADEDVVEDEQDMAFETRPAKIQYTEE